MARLASRWWPFRLFARECGRFLATPPELLPPLPVLATVIAGTGGPRGRFWPFGDEANDGIVAVAEAAIEHAQVVQLPVLHTVMMDSLAVRDRILAAFR